MHVLCAGHTLGCCCCCCGHRQSLHYNIRDLFGSGEASRTCFLFFSPFDRVSWVEREEPRAEKQKLGASARGVQFVAIVSVYSQTFTRLCRFKKTTKITGGDMVFGRFKMRDRSRKGSWSCLQSRVKVV